LNENWKDEIGSFIVEFCDIEYMSFLLHEQLFPNGDPSHNFKDRTKTVMSQLNGKSKAILKGYLEDALELAERRNTIVHNPMMVQIFKNKVSSELHSETAIFSYKKRDYVSFEEMKNLNVQVTQLKSKLVGEIGGHEALIKLTRQ